MTELAQSLLHGLAIASVLTVGATGIALLPWTDAEVADTWRALRRLHRVGQRLALDAADLRRVEVLRRVGAVARELVAPPAAMLRYDTSPGTTP